ncbi:MAG: FtsB family cell division protein [Candidatus Acidiferrales bacterium]
MDHPINNAPEAFAAQIRNFLRRNLNWFVGGALALLLLQDIFGTHGLIAMRRSHQEAVQVQKEIGQINEENRQLQGRVKNLKSDPQAIERIAREEMGLARPGEYIFKTSPKPGDPADPGAIPANPAK